ncbi:FecR family protein [Fodinibius roseus]|uniref:FecR family protein n=1 Tax=Fodinibius roseus TaxID=1194090 RepID=A0A1M5IQG1_9BACT|nr:FecR domain-containing protein [Fodinibius roseus]SHG30475.1 FecR family protein [Fodinibius roseus]
MNEEDISWIKILRYVQGESSPEEHAEVQKWIDSDPDHEEIMLFVEKLLETPAESKEDWDVDSAWLRYNIRHGRDFEEQEDEEEEDIAGLKAVKKKGSEVSANKRAPKFKWGLVAAAAAMITVILLFTVPGERGEPVSDVRVPTNKEIVSEHGQRTHLRLSDGTRVILNAGSKMITPETFSDSLRRVELEGQAFFNVATDSARPFLVVTDRSVTEVLGTQFDVRAYSEDEQVEVTVAEGKVALRAKQDTAKRNGKEITHNQQGSLSPAGIAEVTEVENLAVHLGWTEGKLVFSNQQFLRVKRTLERYYNITIEIESDNGEQLRDRRFTGSFTDSQPLEEVLEAIALSLEMEYREDSSSDNSYTFFKK